MAWWHNDNGKEEKSERSRRLAETADFNEKKGIINTKDLFEMKSNGRHTGRV